MKKITKNLLLGAAAVYGSTFQAVACTGISLTARDGSYVQARDVVTRRVAKRICDYSTWQQLYIVPHLQVRNGLRRFSAKQILAWSVVLCRPKRIYTQRNCTGGGYLCSFSPPYGGYGAYNLCTETNGHLRLILPGDKNRHISRTVFLIPFKLVLKHAIAFALSFCEGRQSVYRMFCEGNTVLHEPP